MTVDRSTRALRADLADRVAASLPGDEYLAEGSRPGTDGNERWYGRLTVRAFAAVTDEPPDVGVLATAAAVELLGEYQRGRTALLAESVADATETLDPDRALLAGDYRFAAAFHALEPLPPVERDRAFGILVPAASTIIETTAANGPRRSRSAEDALAFVEGTAGTLGTAAARIGVALADTDSDPIVGFGCHAATARGIDAHLTSDGPIVAGADAADRATLRDRASRCRRDAERAFRRAGRPSPLRRFVEQSPREFDRSTSGRS